MLTRTDRRRFPILLAAVAALALAMAMLFSPGQAQAQTIVLVSNIGQTVDAFVRPNPVTKTHALQFTTGGNTGGYNLNSVELKVHTYENVVVTVSLYSDSSGVPGSSIFTFTNPSTGVTTDAVNTFTAPPNTTLTGSNTPYHIVVSGANDPDQSSNSFRLTATTSDAEDAGGAVNAEGTADWEIGGDGYSLQSDNTWADSSSKIQIRVNGSAVGSDTPAQSTDATLSDLSLGSGVTLDPAFASGTYEYAASVAHGVEEVTVTATKNHTGADVDYLDADDADLEDADDTDDGHQVALDVGDTKFKVKVTAEDGTTTQTYSVKVTRAPCTLNTGDIWCGVVDVGEVNAGGVLRGHGFIDTDTITAADLAGHPDNRMFAVGDNDYTVQGVYVGTGTNREGRLAFSLTADLSDNDEGGLVLTLDGVTTPRAFFGAAGTLTGIYEWDTDLDWSSTPQVTVRLREAVRPTITDVSVTSTPVLGTDTYGAGETIEVSVTFSEAVDATSDTDFVLSVAGGKRAPLLRGSGTATLVFGYTVAPGDEDDNGIWIGDQDQTLVGSRNGESQNGTITSAAIATAVDLTHDELGTQSDHKVDGTRSIVSVAVSSTPMLETDTYGRARRSASR